MGKQEKKERQAKAEAAYKSFTKDIQSLERDEDPRKVQEIITEHLSKSDELYPLIKKHLTGSAADAKHMRYLLHLCGETAKKINTGSRPFNLKMVIADLRREHKRKLTEYVTESYVDSLASPPTFEYFYGAIKSTAFELKQRKKRARIQTEDIKPVLAKEKNIATECEQDSTPKEVEQICRRIRRLSETRGNQDIKFLETLVDPTSFTQTVENIFHASFLVKESRVGIRPNGNNEPVITYDWNTDSSQLRDKPKKQSILSFSMKDFERWRGQAGTS